MKATAEIQRLVPVWKAILFPRLYTDDSTNGTSSLLPFEELQDPTSLANCYRCLVNDKDVADTTGADPVDRLELGLALHITGPRYTEVLASTCIAVTIELLPQVFAAAAKSTAETDFAPLSVAEVMNGLVEDLVKHLNILHPNEYATNVSATLQDEQRQMLLEEALSVFHDVISRARYVQDLIQRWELEDAAFRSQFFNGDQLMQVKTYLKVWRDSRRNPLHRTLFLGYV